jgi:two-component sensor histidine kinase
MASLLEEHNVRGQVASASELERLLADAPGLLVVTHEALNTQVTSIISRFLLEQPNWSEMPIIILLDRATSPARVRAALSEAWPRSRQIFYQRPVATLELVSGVQSALLSRFRQREVRDYLERETELRLELNHRVKNILASVMSIFEMTRRGAATIESFSEDFRGRLTALSNVHSEVFLAGGEEVSLTTIAGSTLAPYQLHGQGAVQIAGPEVYVSRAAATTFALCFHELATNALKYGALSQAGGQISLIWSITSGDDPDLCMTWAEKGGPRVVQPTRVGYGTRYVRSALAGLFGSNPELIFDAAGLRVSAAGPIARVALQR